MAMSALVEPIVENPITNGGEMENNLVNVDHMNRSLTIDDAEKFPHSNMKLNKKLGEGGFGRVWSGICFKTSQCFLQQTVAIKVLKEINDIIALHNEAEILQNLSHSSIVQFVGIGEIMVGDNGLMPCILMELMDDGSLNSIVHDRNIHISRRDAIKWALQIAFGLEYMHSLNIVHRDVKPDNILLKCERSVAKIGDFGTSRKINQNDSRNPTGNIGSSHYMAPEVIRAEYYNKSCDVYSFGITLWEMFTRKRPHIRHGQVQVIWAVGRDEQRPPLFHDSIPDPLKDLIENCWHRDVKLRRAMMAICQELERIQHRLAAESNLDISLPSVDSDDECNNGDGQSSSSPKLFEKQLIIIKEIYRERFTKYNPLNFDSDFQFCMDSWIAIKLVGEINEQTDIDDANDNSNDNETDLFQLIADGLARTGLVVITGDPGAGKSLLTQKIVFDYATKLSDENKWNKYDIVILAELRLTIDKKHETIIDLAMDALEKMTGLSKDGKFINRKSNNYNLLVILDGYDESVDGQCRQLDELLGSNGVNREEPINDIDLDFDLIVTRRPTKEINRTEKVTLLNIIGFDTKEKQRQYVEKYFANDENSKGHIESVIKKIETNSSYRQMASTPLLLTFICLVHSMLKTGTRVELYENVIFWCIRRKLNAYPSLLFELNCNDSVSTESNHQTIEEDAVENWSSFEQIKRLGYVCLSHLVDKKYQFNLQNIQPNINISVFEKIGLLISNREGNQIMKYQFEHRTLQEYFAAMFMAYWEDEWKQMGIEYRKVTIEDEVRRYNADELSKCFTEILLAKRESELNETAVAYLIQSTKINFEIYSNDIDESVKQIAYINDILSKCQHIKSLTINLHNISISDTIELRFAPNIAHISLCLMNASFADNQLNLITIDGPDTITVHVINCQIPFERRTAFNAYANQNAHRFQKGISII